MKRFSSLMLVLMLLFSCGEDRQMSVLLHDAELLMDSIPDSAYHMLDDAHGLAMQCPRRQRMHYELLRAKAQNKAYVDFTTDSIMKDVAAYYDRHGTPNQRMMAHYLLGCTYRDMGEAPMTLQCYMDAVDMADTTRTDCDYRTMMSIYGQIADLYDDQAMPVEELEALERCGEYAIKCNDTISYIRSIQLKTRSFNLMNDTAEVMRITKKVYDMYLRRGNIKEAAQSLPIAIARKLGNKDYEEAHSMMEIYESKSGFFDEQGNIQPRYSHYYISKGKYYMGICKYDSAEYFLRKLLKINPSHDVYHELARLFSLKHMNDSATLYLSLSENAIIDDFNALNTESVRQTEAMYNYTRNQLAAKQTLMEVEKYKMSVMFCLLIIACLLLTGYIVYIYFRNQREESEAEIQKKGEELMELSARYTDAQNELVLVEKDRKQYEKTKNEEIKQLEIKIETIQSQLASTKESDREHAVHKTKIVETFRRMAQPNKEGKISPDEKMWEELSRLISNFLPTFHSRITDTIHLSQQEYKITILTRLKFTNGDIAYLLDTTPQRITNAKRSANNKIFQEDSAISFTNNVSNL